MQTTYLSMMRGDQAEGCGLVRLCIALTAIDAALLIFFPFFVLTVIGISAGAVALIVRFSHEAEQG